MKTIKQILAESRQESARDSRTYYHGKAPARLAMYRAKAEKSGKGWREEAITFMGYRKSDGHGGTWQDNHPETVAKYSHLRGAYFCDNFDNFRVVGDGEEISRQEHSRAVDNHGWYMDSFQDDVAVPVVVQIPARNREPQYIPGIRFTGQDGYIVYPLARDRETDKLEAARAADHYAEQYAEEAREDNAKYQAEQDIEDLKEQIEDAKTKIIALFTEFRKARKLGVASEFPTLCATIRQQIRSERHSIDKARKRIDTLTDNYWEAVS